jgi:serine/threonine-protein kinase
MPRRLALAVALALTSVATFGIIAVAAQTGMFGDHHPKTAQAVAQPSAAPNVPPAAPMDVPPTATPVVVTDYVYVDDPTHAPEVQPSAAAPSATSVPASATPEASATARPTRTPSSGAPAPAAPAAQPTQPQAQPTQPQAQPTQPQAQPTSGTQHHEDDGADDHEGSDD